MQLWQQWQQWHWLELPELSISDVSYETWSQGGNPTKRQISNLCYRTKFLMGTTYPLVEHFPKGIFPTGYYTAVWVAGLQPRDL